MRLSEALQINQQPVSPDGRGRKIHLICGFTPLHLQTFLKAYVRRRFPGDEISILGGLFGDLEGNLQRARNQPAEGAVVIIEWSDLDERLGPRASAGWSSAILTDILEQVPARMSRLERGVSELAGRMPVALAAPSLVLLPLTHLPLAQTSAFELHLRCILTDFLNRVFGTGSLRLVSDSALARLSAPPSRRDLKMELHAGFPYSITHAAALAQLSVECLFPPVPKKGLVTDLDDTLWKGILGDVGVSEISWSLDQHSQSHALYQQLLASLADSGVLIAAASKNDSALVQEAFARPDILLKESRVFPFESNWGAKSDSVARILKAWNISADSVVFVDDSPMELAEVAAKYPAIECLRFPSDDPSAIMELLTQLRVLFAKTEIREEDRLRLQSLRSSAALEPAQMREASADFLADLGAKLTLEFAAVPNDRRAFELVNKTNQFNLNAQRYTETEWRDYFQKTEAFLLTATYEDRFGPLGKIAVLGGCRQPGKVRVDIWVMSCRAFSRQIEFQIVQCLYDRFNNDRIVFAFRPTGRNAPVQEFFARFWPDGLPQDGLELEASVFAEFCPQLFHQVIEPSHEQLI